MREEIIVSGRLNQLVDPHLNIWHWQIPLYLFIGGMAAGILFFASLYYIIGREKEFETAVKKAPFLVPVLLVIGLFCLFLDLRHKAFFWQLYTTIRIQSPMSWGAWVLMLVTPLSFIWCALNIKTLWPTWKWKYSWLNDLENFFISHKLAIAWTMLISSVILGIYTGILFSAFNARPLWNTSILGPLFLTSGLSAGAACIVLLSQKATERIVFAKIDLLLIGIELFLIVHMFMGFLASTQVQIDAAALFLGGPYTTSFWIFVVFLGMIFPAILEIGSLMMRFLIAFAGQESRWLY
jgi:protein NrfD